ncbi:hypothetical protein J6590_015459 [Homalodisca vitripennis]|nr:hypothetical protein J6590_015458 [Homalodisca vitripennis]KAG8337791.1 hypothetical protein J6590_015459 [Homalodisca vitripennis]
MDPNQDLSGTKPESLEPNQDQSGTKPESLEPNQDQSGTKPESLGPNQDQSGTKPESLEPNQDQSGTSPESLEPNQDQSDTTPESLEPNQDQSDTTPESLEPNQEQFGTSSHTSNGSPASNSSPVGASCYGPQLGQVDEPPTPTFPRPIEQLRAEVQFLEPIMFTPLLIEELLMYLPYIRGNPYVRIYEVPRDRFWRMLRRRRFNRL